MSAEKWYVGANLNRTISYDFDYVGNLEWVSDPSATYDYEYDALGRQTAVTQTIVGLTPNVRFDRSYDAEDRMTSSRATIGGVADYRNDYLYDALGRVAQLTQSSQSGQAVSPKRVDLGYNNASELYSVLRRVGTTGSSFVAESNFYYDEHGWL